MRIRGTSREFRILDLISDDIPHQIGTILGDTGFDGVVDDFGGILVAVDQVAHHGLEHRAADRTAFLAAGQLVQRAMVLPPVIARIQVDGAFRKPLARLQQRVAEAFVVRDAFHGTLAQGLEEMILRLDRLGLRCSLTYCVDDCVADLLGQFCLGDTLVPPGRTAFRFSTFDRSLLHIPLDGLLECVLVFPVDTEFVSQLVHVLFVLLPLLDLIGCLCAAALAIRLVARFVHGALLRDIAFSLRRILPELLRILAAPARPFSETFVIIFREVLVEPADPVAGLIIFRIKRLRGSSTRIRQSHRPVAILADIPADIIRIVVAEETLLPVILDRFDRRRFHRIGRPRNITRPAGAFRADRRRCTARRGHS